MNKIDDWLNPGSIIPITAESVSILIEHIKDMYGIKKDSVSYLVLNYPNRNQWFESKLPHKHDCIKIVRDANTNTLKSVEIL